jgi:hypothetical protein
MKEDQLEGLGVSGRTKVKQIIKSDWAKRGLGELGPGWFQLASSSV